MHDQSVISLSMISDKITVVYATSPHRFGEEDLMINFSIESVKSFGLKGCDIIICADGINPNSNYARKEETEKYKTYIQKLTDRYGADNLCVSDKHIGLTKNYLQAWEHKKIKTENVFFMNHDVALLPTFLDLDIEEIINDRPDFVNTTIFPRDSFDAVPGKNWWRVQEVSKHPLNKQFKNAWAKDCKMAFGNQDHGCIIKTDFFQEFVSRFYEPKKTFFLEDSVQDYLRKIDNDDFESWAKVGGCVWKGSYTFHLDGHSKAGAEHKQENNRKGESVWSPGNIVTKNLKSIKTNKNSTKELLDTLQKLLEIEKKGIAIRTYENYKKFAWDLFHLHAINHTQGAGIEENLTLNPTTSKVPLPLEDENYKFSINYGIESFKISWKNLENDRLILNLNEGKRKIRWGGHQRNCINLFYKEEAIFRNSLINLEAFNYSQESKPSIAKEDFETALVSSDKKGGIYISWENPEGLELKMHLKDSFGNILEEQAKEGLYKYNAASLLPADFLMGWFDVSSNKNQLGKTWNFIIEIKEYLYSNFNPVDLCLSCCSEIEKASGVTQLLNQKAI